MSKLNTKNRNNFMGIGLIELNWLNNPSGNEISF